ncbi:hypothetical protein [Nisaea sp.]|uniref:hypothetical protein n=1 Tax=Nisaea sp. TaxID=2024842 RepID=UPI0032EDAB6A
MDNNGETDGPPGLCFVVTSHDPLAHDLRDRIAEPAIHKAGLLVLRSDDVELGDRHAPTIWTSIEKSAAILAVVTAQSPHVFYELGIAHGLGKKTLVVVTENIELPVDTSEMNVFYVDGDALENRELPAKLAEILKPAGRG